MTMSEFSERWMRMDSSGVRNSRAPSMGEANFTPSSVILRMPCRLNTWKPPESVRMGLRSEEHTSELQSLMRISYAVFCLQKKKHIKEKSTYDHHQHIQN